VLCHARRDPDLHGLQIAWDGGTEVQLSHPATWGASYPQSAWLLQEEVQAWQKTLWALHVRATG